MSIWCLPREHSRCFPREYSIGKFLRWKKSKQGELEVLPKRALKVLW